ncbi:MAG: hypothetical protein CL608_00775 [Anaerolineaceae bacterium]|nr:hypothetical protein [Anaerolineaceae bacterium]
MEDLIDFVSERAKLPLPAAENATSATLAYLTPRFSPLLKSTVEVMLHHPHLSDAEKDLLIASRVLFPKDSTFTEDPPRLND